MNFPFNGERIKTVLFSNVHQDHKLKNNSEIQKSTTLSGHRLEKELETSVDLIIPEK